MVNNIQTQTASEHKDLQKKEYIRFDLNQRIEHIVLLAAFTILAVTGLPQKFPTSPMSQFVIRGFGGIETARSIHHFFAVILLMVSIYHVIDVLYRLIVLRFSWSMIPVVEDFIHFFNDLGYYFGVNQHKAYYPRYNYVEKVEYLAVVWGTIIMAITGFIMWNPIAVTKYLPGQIIPASKTAHGGEAILAVLSIIIWHFYHVHIRQLNKSMFIGKISRYEMEEEHPAELAQLESEMVEIPPVEVIRHRQKIFFPIATLITLILGLGLIGFVTLEDTALKTVPKGETANVYVPVTPTPKPSATPTPTRSPGEQVAEESWDGKYQAMFDNRCGTCHGITSVGGLSLATYQSALQGGKSGPAIVPGDPDTSVLVQIQSSGNHPGQLTIDELNQVIQWILAGAPEN